jgi:hypothetical protein
LSNDVSFMREKSSLQAGTGVKTIPSLPEGITFGSELKN